jgi:hypothetical protein
MSAATSRLNGGRGVSSSDSMRRAFARMSRLAIVRFSRACSGHALRVTSRAGTRHRLSARRTRTTCKMMPTTIDSNETATITQNRNCS